MMRMALFAGLLFGVYWLVGWIRRLEPADRRRAVKWTLGAAVLGAFAFLLIRLGLNWFTVAGSTAALATLRRIIPWLARAARLRPLARRAWAARPRLQDGNHHPGAVAPKAEDVPGEMSRQEALAVLGLAEGASRDRIAQVSRELLASVTPSAATSSPYLIRQITRARDTLLGSTVA